MLESVSAFLNQGKRDRAQEFLRASMLEFCADAFAKGEIHHPLSGAASAELRVELTRLARQLLENPDRSRTVVVALESADRAIRKREASPETLDRLNFALQKLIPDIALVLDEALDQARFKLGGAVSDVEDPLSGMNRFMPADVGLLATLAGEGLRALDGSRLDKLQTVSLRDFDATGPGLGESPSVFGLKDDVLSFGCPGCLERAEAPLDTFGESILCGCGQPLRVPRPSLERMGVYLKARKDAALGISRCRVCNGVIQLGRDGFMHAGFCSVLCAKQGLERFGEYVPRQGILDGEDVRFQCSCGTTMSAPRSEVGGKIACPSCPLEVWIPAPQQEGRQRRGLRACGNCGKPMKASALKCMYCGSPAPQS
ncbi:MAG: hypothetical protein HY293_21360 [Planctomycetes bacterium]|nr:hypothetical protein [Planctomycetota bacterium]